MENGLGPCDLPNNLESQVAIIYLESLEIQYQSRLVGNSITLKHYNLAKSSFEREDYSKFNLNDKALCE